MTDRATDPPRPAPPADEDSGFLGRWSRRKRAAEAGAPLPETPAPLPPEAPPAGAAPELPDPATLGPDADFSAYLQARVPQPLKQAALRKLFSDPAFNRMDGLDVYIDDYNQLPDLPAGEAALLTHARETLFPGTEATSSPEEQASPRGEELAENPAPPAEGPAAASEPPSPDGTAAG